MTIWFACIWDIWKARNKTVFQAKRTEIAVIVEEVKFTVLEFDEC